LPIFDKTEKILSSDGSCALLQHGQIVQMICWDHSTNKHIYE